MTDPSATPGRVVTVVVPHFNDPRLPASLDALDALRTPPGWRIELIVVDNGSEQSPRAVVEAHRGAIYLSEPRGGSYAARNTALQVATGEIVAFTDSDCRPDPDWLVAALRHLEEHPEVAAVAGRVQTVFDTKRPESAVGWWEALEAFPQHVYVKEGFGVTANLVVRRSAGDALGWFDGAALSGGDREFGGRLTASGQVVAYEPEAVVSHPARTSWRDFLTKGRRTAKGQGRLDAIQGAGAASFLRSVVRLGINVLQIGKRGLTDPRLPDWSARLQYMGVGVFFRVFWFVERYRWRAHYRRHPDGAAPGVGAAAPTAFPSA